MLNPNNLTKEQMRSIYDRFVRTIFGLAPFLGIWFDDTEIKYIETKMMTHKLYRLVTGKAAGIDWRDWSAQSLFKFQREWLLDFTNDPELPIGVRAFIYYYIGHEQASMQKYNCVTNEMRTRDISLTDRFLAQRWMERCR